MMPKQHEVPMKLARFGVFEIGSHMPLHKDGLKYVVSSMKDTGERVYGSAVGHYYNIDSAQAAADALNVAAQCYEAEDGSHVTYWTGPLTKLFNALNPLEIGCGPDSVN
jgi:hypothetical protein